MDKIFAPIKRRIIEYIDYKGITKESFYTESGVSASNFKGKGAISELGGDKIAKILTLYDDLDAQWLLIGQGEMIKQPTASVPVVNKFELRTDQEVEQQRVPLFEMEAAASILSIETDPHKEMRPTGYISIPNLPVCDGAIFVRGDSMYPLIKSGDAVLYKQVHSLDWLLWGEMYMVAFTQNGDDFIVVKYINKVDDDPERIRLVSFNHHHAPIEIHLSSIRALALIKASVRYHTMG